jgi:hypothetical protein
MSGVSKPYCELYSPVRNDAPELHLRWRFALKTDVVQNWLGAQPKLFFSDGIKNLWNTGTGALKSKGITLKSNISFVSVYLK